MRHLEKLDHVNLRTTQLGAMIDWYTNILGMHSGARPDFSFPGAWMYVGNSAAVHLVGTDGSAGAGAEVKLKLEHFAFSARDSAGFQAALDSFGEKYNRVELPGFNLIQYNLWDPDGNHIHVDFPLDE
ncbi:MAG: glyoxalase [Granulosicoccus sp.]|nr:glyoxalase [Granulosicoccus sp.]